MWSGTKIYALVELGDVYGNGVNEVLAMFTPYHAGDPTDWDDFVEFVETWLCDTNDTCYEPGYDHNSDNIVNFEDFAYFAGVWDIPSNQESNWYYLRDALGSVRGIIGGRFNREDDREFYNYDVYGRLSIQNPEESVSGNPYLFAGYHYDAETELYHTLRRTYDPETGRWLQIDPIGYADGMNLYGYVRSNPVTYFDPFGLSCVGGACGVGSLKDDLIGLLASGFADGPSCCGGKSYDQEKECCENNRIVEKQPVYIINRGGPNQGGSKKGSPDWTGGHIDLSVPDLGMIGFYGTGAGGILPGMGLEGYFNHSWQEWARPGRMGGRGWYINGQYGPVLNDNGQWVNSSGVLSIICEVKVCPFIAKKMIERYGELRANPGKFNIVGRNCSTVANQILSAGGVTPNEIPGIDNPQSLIKELEKNGAKCFKGYTALPGPGPYRPVIIPVQ